jgi:hypothetical protein
LGWRVHAQYCQQNPGAEGQIDPQGWHLCPYYNGSPPGK